MSEGVTIYQVEQAVCRKQQKDSVYLEVFIITLDYIILHLPRLLCPSCAVGVRISVVEKGEKEKSDVCTNKGKRANFEVDFLLSFL